MKVFSSCTRVQGPRTELWGEWSNWPPEMNHTFNSWVNFFFNVFHVKYNTKRENVQGRIHDMIRWLGIFPILRVVFCLSNWTANFVSSKSSSSRTAGIQHTSAAVVTMLIQRTVQKWRGENYPNKLCCHTKDGVVRYEYNNFIIL